jgi:hypothetical protein
MEMSALYDFSLLLSHSTWISLAFSDSGRIFAYFVDRYVCVVAIDPNHINIH